MEVIIDVLARSGLSDRAAAMFALLLVFLPLMLFFTVLAYQGWRPALRPIPGFDALHGLVNQAAETGQALHISLGVGGIGGATTGETLAGLTVLEYLSKQPAFCDAPPVITLADPSLLPAAQDIVRHAYIRQGEIDRCDLTRVRFIAPQPIAYANGVMGILGREDLTANIMVGSFGDEYLLMGETGAEKGVTQIAGAASPETLPFVFASAEHILMGEEMFSAGAYLSFLPAHIGSLMAQDWVRFLLAAIIFIGVIAKTFF